MGAVLLSLVRDVYMYIDRHGVGRWALNLVFIVLLAFAGLYVHRENAKWVPVLCGSKQNIESQIADSRLKLKRQEDFLGDYDSGKRHLVDFSRADIVLAIMDQQALLGRQEKALVPYESLNCKE
jgi:hypothetical protein